MHRWFVVVALICASCSSQDEPASEDMGGGSLDAFIISNNDMAAPPEWVRVRIEDQTPTGQGLALDAVELCDQLGTGCVGLVASASSDDTLDYAGANDGPNSQDSTCTEATFTRLSGEGAWVEFDRLESGFPTNQQLNVWTGASDCPLIEAGDKPFTVTFYTADGAASDVESCAGTCSASVP